MHVLQSRGKTINNQADSKLRRRGLIHGNCMSQRRVELIAVGIARGGNQPAGVVRPHGVGIEGTGRTGALLFDVDDNIIGVRGLQRVLKTPVLDDLPIGVAGLDAILRLGVERIPVGRVLVLPIVKLRTCVVALRTGGKEHTACHNGKQCPTPFLYDALDVDVHSLPVV